MARFKNERWRKKRRALVAAADLRHVFRRGEDVLVLDKSGIAAGASGVADGVEVGMG